MSRGLTACTAFLLAFLLSGVPCLAQSSVDSPSEDAATAAEPEDLPGPPIPVSPEPPPRAMLGVYATSAATPSDFRFPFVVPQGALITSLVPGSPADRAGLPVGGVIVAFDGQRINAPEDLARFVRAANPGQKVELQYLLGNRVFRRTVQLAPSPPSIEGVPSPLPQSELRFRVVPNSPRALREGAESPADPYAPPAGRPPVATLPFADPSTSLAEIRAQVEALQRQLEELREKMAALERKLAERTPE